LSTLSINSLKELFPKSTLREGLFSRSTPDIAEEIEIFRGDQNRIIFQHVYCKDFKVYEISILRN
jgi:hypothetical protein